MKKFLQNFKKIVVLALGFFSLNGFSAEDPILVTQLAKRPSQLELMALTGKGDFRASELSVGLGLDTRWKLNGMIGSEKSYGVTSARLFELGVDLRTSADFSTSLGIISRREPDEVLGRGMSLGLSWNAASLWGGVYETRLSSSVRMMKYKQDAGSRTRVREGGIPENSLTLGLSQELDSTWMLKGSYTGYGYGNSTPQELSQAISNRSNVPEGLYQLVEGFPKRSTLLGVDWQVTESLLLGLNFFRTDFANSSEARGLSVFMNYDFSAQWTGGFFTTGSKSSTDVRSSLFGLSFGYKW
jgi:hypothetical protein